MRANVCDCCPISIDHGGMSLRTHFQPGANIIQVHGAVEACNAARLRDHVNELGTARPLVVDIRRVGLFSGNGLRTLVAIAGKFQRAQSQVVLVTNGVIDRLLRALDRHHTLPVTGSVDDALERLMASSHPQSERQRIAAREHTGC